MKWLTTGQVARDYGVSPQTIRRWISYGSFEHIQRTKRGQFRIGHACDTQNVGYTRVSSRKQISSLETQQSQIRAVRPHIEIVADIGSGFNFKRKGFVALLERAMSGSAIDVVVSNRDRLSRVGFEFVRAIFERSGGSVTALNQAGDTSQFSTDLLVGFITSFCNSYYGRRSAAGKRRKPQNQNLSE